MSADRLVASHNTLVLALLDALGLPPKGIRGIEIRAYANEVVQVTVERFVYEPELKKVNELLERYHLVAEPKPQDVTSLGDQAVQHIVSIS